MTGPLQHIDALERALAAKGFPAMSPWWRATIERFYRGHQRQLVLRVGRRGGKSSTLARVAVLEALFGRHQIPPGDVGVVAIVSVSRDEASQRLRTIKAILDALGTAWRPIDGGIELASRPITFKVFAASIAGVSGFTAIAAIGDEVAKWRDAETGANPATEVLASLRPTLATQPNARLFLSSSPLGELDAHAKAFAEGDTNFQITAFAPTWLAHPTLSEEETHRLEPDPATHAREYGAQPQIGALVPFPPDQVQRTIRPLATPLAAGRWVVVTDSSAGRGDAWTGARARWVKVAADRFEIQVARAWAIEGKFGQSVSADGILDHLAHEATIGDGARTIAADQFQAFFLASGLTKRGCHFVGLSWTNESKAQAVAHVRTWLREGVLAIEPGPEAEKLRRELAQFEQKVTPSGLLSFGARRAAHDDRVALLLNAALLDLSGAFLKPGEGIDKAPAPIMLENTIALAETGRDAHDRDGAAMVGGIVGANGPSAFSPPAAATADDLMRRVLHADAQGGTP